MKILGINNNIARTKTINNNRSNNVLKNYRQISDLSNVYYQPINFARSLKEHKSWGLTFNQDEINAKIFTYPDAKNVSIEVYKDDNKAVVYPLNNKGEGVFESKLPEKSVKSGDRYLFVIEKADGTVEKVKDPYSSRQIELLGPSVAYNHSDFAWSDEEWFSLDNKERISRKANSQNGLISPKGAVIYELHIPTLTKKGTFESAKEELKRIKSLGYNAIEIMPVENTYSYNWGYDGVDKFAPANYMGGADKLKELINEAHNSGLNVIMDMVPNHLGPDGAQLLKTGPYMAGSTPWGEGFNYEGKNSHYVRDFIVNVALNWIQNYHCDGLRLDMTKFMNSDTTMQQIAAEVNYHNPEAFLIAEDARSNISVRGDDYWHDWWQPHDERIINKLRPSEIAIGLSEQTHSEKINSIANGEISLARIGFDSEWDFHFYHTLNKLAYGEADLDALERAVAVSGARVKYTTSHDETGNMDGTRIVAKYMVPLLKLNDYIYLDDEDMQRVEEYVELKSKNGGYCSSDEAYNVVKSQKAQQSAMKIAQMYQMGKIDKFNSKELRPYFESFILDDLGIDRASFITPKRIKQAFETAVRKYRAIEALKYFTPGPVMTFQGEENLQMNKFNFFREFDSIKDEHYLYIEKGYPNGRPAFEESKIGSVRADKAGALRMKRFETLISDLNFLKSSKPSMISGQIMLENTVKHPQNPTIALHSVDSSTGDETFIISNFSNVDYPTYEIEFPKGKWSEIINTNDEKYGGSGTCQNAQFINGVGRKNIKSKIALPAQSSLIFTRVK